MAEVMSDAVVGAASTRYAERSLEDRQKESQKIREKYPERTPVIVEKLRKKQKFLRYGKTDPLPELLKSKYLVPSDLPWQQFQCLIRRRLRLTPDKAIFMFVNGTLPNPNHTVGQLEVDDAGFLFCTYTSENTFGF
jgi:GABA(A) receptor-associated protein